MELNGDQVVPINTQKRTYITIFSVIFIVIIGCYFISQYDLSRKIHRKASKLIDRFIIDTSDADISFFVIGDSHEDAPSPDLRGGKFWEPQLAKIGKNLTIHYIADKPLPNAKWTIPASVSATGSDPGFCGRNIESWTIFATEKTKRWYFKAQQSTYINIENILLLINSLEKKINPMKQAYFQFAGVESIESNNVIYPDAASGWLLSSAAVRTIFNNLKHFSYICDKLGEEIALGQMILDLKFDVEDFVNPNFIPNWPKDVLDVIGKEAHDKSKIKKCPSKQYRFSQQLEVPFGNLDQIVATNLGKIPMNKAVQIIEGLPGTDLRIGYPTDKPVFCLE